MFLSIVQEVGISYRASDVKVVEQLYRIRGNFRGKEIDGDYYRVNGIQLLCHKDV